MRCTRRATGTEAHVVWVLLDWSKHIWRRSESVSRNSTVSNNLKVTKQDCLSITARECKSMANFYLFLIGQWQKTAQVFVVNVECCVLLNMRGEDWPIWSVQSVAVFSQPVGHVGSSVVLIDDTVLSDVINSGEHCNAIRTCGVLTVEQTELVIRKFLFLRNNILGQFQEWIFITPEKLTNGHFNEGFDLQNVHDTGHGQTKEPSGMFTLRSGAQHGNVWNDDNIVL